MQADKLPVEDGLMLRSLVDFPGGLELHIGVGVARVLLLGGGQRQARPGEGRFVARRPRCPCTHDRHHSERSLTPPPPGPAPARCPLPPHAQMFIPTIMSQGSPEQQAKWLPLCMSLQVIGTYAQTELGHGTFVRGLETTATYDPQARQSRGAPGLGVAARFGAGTRFVECGVYRGPDGAARRPPADGLGPG